MTPATQSAPVSFVDVTIEETTLAYALKDASTFQEAIEVLDSSLFEDKRHKAVWDSAVGYYEKFQGLIDDKGLEAFLDDAKAPSDKKASYHLLFSILKSRSISKPQFTLSTQQLKQLKQKRKLYDIADRIATGLKDTSADLTKLSSEVTSKLLDLDSASATTFREASLRENLVSRVSEYKDREINPQKYLGIPFGIKKLDELTAGIFPEEFGLFYGRGGAGKSRTLASVAYNMFSRGYNVMYVTIEMPMGQVGRLFDSRHFLISSAGLRHGKLSEGDKKKYFTGQVQLEASPGDFYVVDAPQGCSFASLLPIVRKYKARKKLDVIVIDYLNLMQASGKHTDGNEPLRIGTIGRELKTMARLERVAVLSASQATRAVADIENIDEVGTEHVSWSDLLSYQCDLMVFLRKGDPTAALTHTLDAMIVKYRDGSNQKIQLGADWDKTFVGDMETYLRLSGAIAETSPAVKIDNKPADTAVAKEKINVESGTK